MPVLAQFRQSGLTDHAARATRGCRACSRPIRQETGCPALDPCRRLAWLGLARPGPQFQELSGLFGAAGRVHSTSPSCRVDHVFPS